MSDKDKDNNLQHLAAIVRDSDDAILGKTPQGIITSWNTGAERIYGYTAEEAIGRTVAMLVPPDRKDELPEILQKITHGEGINHVDTQRVTKDGKVVDISLTVSPIHDASGSGAIIGASSTGRDVTREKEAEEEILKLAAVVESSNDAIICTDPEGTIISWNAAATALYGYRADEVIGRSFGLLIPPDRQEVARHILERLQLGERIGRFETRWLRKDATEIPVSVSISPMLDATGRVLGASTITRSITVRKRVEKMLYQTSQVEAGRRSLSVSGELLIIFALAITAFALLVYFDVADDILRLILSLETIELDGLFLTTVFLAFAFIVFAYRRWKALTLQVEARTKAEEALHGLHDELELRVQERTTDLVKVNNALRSEIIERQKAEESLRESEQRYKQMFEGNGSVQWLIDPATGSIVEANQAASDFYGYSLEVLKGMNIVDINMSVGKEKAKELLVRMSQEAVTIVSRHTLASGELRDTQGYTCPIDIGGRRLVHEIITDITEQKRAEGARTAQEAAERANHAKSEFLSRMSHELRTPLNAILGFGQLLEMDDITSEQQESVGYILKAGEHLLNLINEVLDIARIEEGKLSISMEPVFVHDVLQESLVLVQPLAARRNIEMKADLTRMDYCYVMADRQRLQQVLLNLLANAIKYNRKGGVVTVSCEERESHLHHQGDGSGMPAHKMLCIKVSDTGHGLSPDKVARLFTPFERLGAEQGDVEGTGLGLALSKHLVEAMGGSIGVESEPGTGSTFWVELSPADEQMAALEQMVVGPFSNIHAQTGEQAPTRTVLYIEDNLSNLRLIERILRQLPGISLMTAMQGQMGLDMAYEHTPDLILLDLHLPDMAGNEVLRRLQEDPHTGSIPVVVLSADANPRQVEKLLEAGARTYLTKPFNVKQLFEVLEEITAPALSVG